MQKTPKLGKSNKIYPGDYCLVTKENAHDCRVCFVALHSENLFSAVDEIASNNFMIFVLWTVNEISLLQSVAKVKQAGGSRDRPPDRKRSNGFNGERKGRFEE